MASVFQRGLQGRVSKKIGVDRFSLFCYAVPRTLDGSTAFRTATRWTSTPLRTSSSPSTRLHRSRSGVAHPRCGHETSDPMRPWKNTGRTRCARPRTCAPQGDDSLCHHAWSTESVRHATNPQMVMDLLDTAKVAEVTIDTSQSMTELMEAITRLQRSVVTPLSTPQQPSSG